MVGWDLFTGKQMEKEQEQAMNTTVTASVATAIGLVLAACAGQATPAPTQPPETTQASGPTQAAEPTQSPAGTDQLAGTSWTLTQLNGRSVLTDTVATLNFSTEGRVSGTDGCNSFNGAYTADGSTLQIQQPLATTLMACPDPIMNQATAYQAALAATTSYQVAGKELTLLDAGGQAVASLSAQSSGLAGTSWDVVSYNNGQSAVVSTIVGTSLTATFDAGGQLAGSAGCNHYGAPYETDGLTTIKIGPTNTTRMMCAEPQGVMEQEQQYLAALESAATYGIDGDKLEMRTAQDTIAASFQKAQQ